MTAVLVAIATAAIVVDGDCWDTSSAANRIHIFTATTATIHQGLHKQLLFTHLVDWVENEHVCSKQNNIVEILRIYIILKGILCVYKLKHLRTLVFGDSSPCMAVSLLVDDD